MSETMKALKCELCGSNELVKQDDYFVCQSCGTKYTPEAAQKLIIDIDSPVPIVGAVEVMTGNFEKSRRLNNLNTLFELKQWHDFNDELKKAVRDYPDEWKVWFFSFKYNMIPHGYPQDPMKSSDGSSISYLNCFPNFEDDIIKAKQVCPEEELTNLSKCYVDFFNYLISEIERKNFVILYRDAKRLSTSSYLFENQKWIEYIQKYVYDCENAARTIKNELADYQKRSICLKTNNGTYNFTGEDIQNAQYFDGHSLGKIEFRTGYEISSYGDYITIDELIKQIKEQNPIGGCYVATCVYGSYDCPEVWILRRFRDNTLSKTWYGKAFISTYYAISPILVKCFGDTDLFKRFWKAIIDRMIIKLKNKGVDDAPYTDK